MGILVDNIINGIFLFMLVSFSNYINKIIPNVLDEFIYKSILFQHLIVLFLIYFSVELVDDTNQSPLDNFYNCLITYVFYLIFSNSDTYIAILILFLLAFMYILINERTYLRNKGSSHTGLNTVIDFVSLVLVVLIVISLIMIFLRKAKYDKRFNYFLSI